MTADPMAGQLELFEAVPVALSDVDAADLWVEKMREHSRVCEVVEHFPEAQREAVTLATILVGGFRAWREAAPSRELVMILRGCFLGKLRAG